MKTLSTTPAFLPATVPSARVQLPAAAAPPEADTVTLATPSQPEKAEHGPLGKAVDWLDRYTSPRPHTEGNFAKASAFQAIFQGAAEGYYLFGPLGLLTGSSSAFTGVSVQNKTGSVMLGTAAGCATGALLGAGLSYAGVGGMHKMVIGGALLGAFQTIRGNSLSRVRDSGGNATMVSAFFVPGPAKMAGGLGAAVGAHCDSKLTRALVGAASGAALGAGLSAIGFAPVSMTTMVAGSALAGGIGPFMGPRFSQFFRNLAEDIGTGVDKALVKAGLRDESLPPKLQNAIGSIPAAFIKEGIRGWKYSDGGLMGFVVGGAMESIQQIHIAYFSKEAEGQQAKQPEAPPPARPGEPAPLTSRSGD